MRARWGAIVTTMLVLGGPAAVWANHNAPPTTVNLPAGGGRLTLSTESRKGPGAAGVDCQAPANSANGTECYNDYQNSKGGSGGTAQYPFARDIVGTNPANGGTTAGPVTWGGLYANTPGGPSGNGRVWTGVNVAGLGQLAIAAGGGATDNNGHPHGCVSAYAEDGTSGGQISSKLPPPVSDDNTDTDTDAQVCGVIGGS